MATIAPESSARETPEATAPVCRNCGATASGDYCSRCGQETAVQLPSAPQFLKDAAGRYVALDGRMWRTLVPLLVHPGFLTREYLAGRRKRYIRPARLFLVLSLLLFAVLRFVVEVPTLVAAEEALRNEAEAASKTDPEKVKDAAGMEFFPGLGVWLDQDANLTITAADSPLTQEVKRRLARFNALSRQEKADQVFLGTMRYGPYAMFVLLPACALLFQLAYLGRAKRYPGRPRRYAEHLVFAAHNHAFMALLVTVAALVDWGPAWSMLTLWSIVYGVWSTKVVYRGRWSGVFARAFLIGVLYFTLFAVVTVGLILAAVVIR